jgi:hypothetical protein
MKNYYIKKSIHPPLKLIQLVFNEIGCIEILLQSTEM